MAPKLAVVRTLLGSGDRTEENPGTFTNVGVEEGLPLRCGAGQVLISVKAACVNYPDLLQTVGGYQHKPELPYTPGIEGAGVVTQVGPKVRGFRVGDRVSTGGLGMMATDVLRPAAMCRRIPDTYSFAEGASFAVAYETAYHCLVERANLREGEWVLIHGATGGVGLAAVQVARVLGAKIIATGGTDEKLAGVTAQGAHVVVNYTKHPRFRDIVKRASGGGVAVAFDPVGGDVLLETVRCAGYGCRICVVGFTSGKRPSIPSNHVLIKGISLLGCRAGQAVREGQADGAARRRKLEEWAEKRLIVPHVSHVFPLEDVQAAFRAVWDRKVLGRCVVAPCGVQEAVAQPSKL